MRRSDHLVAVPNVSEGRDPGAIASFAEVVRAAGARVLDLHSDRVHNRSVLTVGAEAATLVEAMARLARAATAIDLTEHEGVHPRLGGLDVCPFVVDRGPAEDVIAVARAAGAAVAERAGVPVYLYGYAATRAESERLPAIRKGGLARLIERSHDDFPPDFGALPIDPRRGVVCVGARDVLIAFNVWLRADLATARRVAGAVRAVLGTAGVRALGLELANGFAQVSTNLTEPHLAGIDDVYREVAAHAAVEGAAVHATEIVGLPPERFLPDPDAEAARLLLEPGRSLESVLRA